MTIFCHSELDSESHSWTFCEGLKILTPYELAGDTGSSPSVVHDNFTVLTPIQIVID